MESIIEWAKAALLMAALMLAFALAGTLDYQDRTQDRTPVATTSSWEQGYRG